MDEESPIHRKEGFNSSTLRREVWSIKTAGSVMAGLVPAIHAGVRRARIRI
jgi:hypothetical protein